MEKEYDIVDTALAAGNFSAQALALRVAGLIEALKDEGPFTVFAPTDDAFERVPAQALSDLLQPENKEKLTAILTYHVVPGKVTAHEAANLDSATTLQGQSLKITKQDGLRVNQAKVIAPDVEASNGVIHVIDAVLMPATSAIA